MGQVHFYHLTRSDLAGTLRVLLAKCQGAGWRVEVRGPQAQTLDHLDAALWLGPPEEFLAHGRAGGALDAAQPILLRAEAEPAAQNAPQALISVEGAAIDAAEVAAHARAIIVFDGSDGTALSRARAQWKELTAAQCPALYWSEESGRWQKKAQKNVGDTALS